MDPFPVYRKIVSRNVVGGIPYDIKAFSPTLGIVSVNFALGGVTAEKERVFQRIEIVPCPVYRVRRYFPFFGAHLRG